MSDPKTPDESSALGSLLKAVPLAIVTSVAAWALGVATKGDPSLAFLQWTGAQTQVVNGLGVLAFWTAIMELRRRSQKIEWEHSALRHGLLPEDVETVIDRSYIPTIFRKLKEVPEAERKAVVCQAVELCATKYQSSTSVGEVAGTVQMYLDNEANHAETNYSFARYLAWAIPSIGFVGTVMGLATALGRFGDEGSVSPPVENVRKADGAQGGATGSQEGKPRRSLMSLVSEDLLLAFNTTFVALALSLVLMFYFHKVSARGDRLFNRIADYCLRHFVTKAYYP